MTTNVRIKHKTSSTAGEVPSLTNVAETNELALGEIAINTHDGKMFIRKEDDQGNYSIVDVTQTSQVDNVLYVSKSGNDTAGDGLTLESSFASIEAALAIATSGTTVFVKSGVYTLQNQTTSQNPMGGVVVPKNVSIVGDNLRTTKVTGLTTTNDLFYVQNASYITNITFIGLNKAADKRQPACVSFPPVALQDNQTPQEIVTSPYVENCTAFNTTATGMLIDGSLTTGLRSMVSDSFTQINAGGTGVHIINRGYAQLVSIFTVSCDHAVLCESGGQCSLTNSNASFGNYGLKATGGSESLYQGVVTASSTPFGSNIEITSTTPPKYGDAFLVDNDTIHYSVEKIVSSLDFTDTGIGGSALPIFNSNGTSTTTHTVYIANHGWKNGQIVKVREVDTLPSALTDGQVYYVLKVDTNNIRLATDSDLSQLITFADIGSGNNTLVPKFMYNVAKCNRDVGLIVDAIVNDVALDTNFNSVYTGISYLRASAYTTVTNTGQKNPTLAAMLEVKRRITQIPSVAANNTTKTRAEQLIDLIIFIFLNGTESVTVPGDLANTSLSMPDTLQIGTTATTAEQTLLSNRSTVISNLLTWIDDQITDANVTNPDTGSDWYNFDFSDPTRRAKCSRDTGFIIDALRYDILYDTNIAVNRVAESYFITNDAGATISQLGPTALQTEEAYEQLKTVLVALISDATLQTKVTDSMNDIISYMTNSSYSLPGPQSFNTTQFANVLPSYDTNIVTGTLAIVAEKSTIQTSASQNIDIYRVETLENVREIYAAGMYVDFKKRSLIAASSMTFEYVGTGTQIQGVTDAGANTDDLYNRPRTDDYPITENEVIFDEATNLGAVYFTSTDHKGDFRIGSEMVINRTAGTIQGDTFNRSLFSVMTPYILAIEGN
jgi:hypothetical protein